MKVSDLDKGSTFIVIGLEGLGDWILINKTLGSARVRRTGIKQVREGVTKWGEAFAIPEKYDATNISLATSVRSA